MGRGLSSVAGWVERISAEVIVYTPARSLIYCALDTARLKPLGLEPGDILCARATSAQAARQVLSRDLGIPAEDFVLQLVKIDDAGEVELVSVIDA